MTQKLAHSGPHQWPLPTPRIRELLKKGAEFALNAPPEWLDELDQASLAADLVTADPVVIAAARRINRSGLIHWAAANIENPGAPVQRYLSADMLSNARELARRGATDLLFSAARSSQNAAWQRWMDIVFALTKEPQELHELLDVSARSIAAFIDVNMEGISEFMKAEREERVRGTHADRRELITEIVEGRAISAQQASRRLGYTLEQSHHAAIIWTEEAEIELGNLEKAADALSRCTENRNALVVVANAATLWVWVYGGSAVDVARLQHQLQALPRVRMAIASSGAGIEGFRRGHLDALATQRLVGRLKAGVSVVHAEQMRLVSLLTQHMESAQQFVTNTLGSLASADPALQLATATFLECGCNITEAANQLHAHRNTLLRRLERAEALLPRPLHQHRLPVAVALEILRWTTNDGR